MRFGLFLLQELFAHNSPEATQWKIHSEPCCLFFVFNTYKFKTYRVPTPLRAVSNK